MNRPFRLCYAIGFLCLMGIITPAAGAPAAVCARPLEISGADSSGLPMWVWRTAGLMNLPGSLGTLIQLGFPVPPLQLADDRLTPYVGPPRTDAQNTILPRMVKTRFDGTVLYNNVPPELALLVDGALVRHPLSDTAGLHGFISDEEWSTPVDGALLYAQVDKKLFEVRQGNLISLDLPEGWTFWDMPPAYFADLDGLFTTAGHQLWFRRQSAATWVSVASVLAPNGPLAISQTDNFGVCIRSGDRGSRGSPAGLHSYRPARTR